MDSSSLALLKRSQIERYSYGAWQDTREIQDYMEGIFKILKKDSSISLLQQPELDQVLCLGEAPTRWKRPSHFPPQEGTNNIIFLTCRGTWHNGDGHFVIVFLCNDYWSILDPLPNSAPPSSRSRLNLHNALKKSYTSQGLPIPALPPFRQLPHLSTQRDFPLSLWSCGTLAMSTTFHLLLGKHLPHTLPPNYITRARMLALYMALLEWLILGTPPLLWDARCLHIDISAMSGGITLLV